MDGQQHSIMDWIASAVLTTLGYFTRLAFGKDKLSKWELVMFYLFCGGVLWITNSYVSNGIIKSSIQLGSGLIIPNVIKGVISGAKGSEKKISNTIENNVENISHKVDKITEALTDDKDKL